MKYITLLSLCIFLLFLLISCSPIQTRYNIPLKKIIENEDITQHVDSTINENIILSEPTDSLIAYPNFEKKIDTTIIHLTTFDEISILDSEFKRANQLFENYEYQQALLLFKNVVKNFTKNDNRFWASRIKISECLEKIGNINESIANLEETYSLIGNDDNPFRSKIILGLANSYCLIGKKPIYLFYRRLLEEKYPNELINLSNCN